MRFLVVFLISLSALFTASCETMKGLGRDIESTAEAVDEAL